ncbi:hypothetical protein ACN20G_32515 (plasmid) [Streptomyces sp. BI20]|uniref:hypothetical protein n=1 Tax=Streptomyces sp. BI20 TaxID=3403460 RepID=UPI003C76DBFB
MSLGRVGTVLGALGVFLALFPPMFFIAVGLGVPAVVLGALALRTLRRRSGSDRSSAWAALTFGTLSVVIACVMLFVIVPAVGDAKDRREAGGSRSGPGAAASESPGPDGSRTSGPEPTPPPTAPKPLAFGGTHTYPNGVTVTVGAPEPFTPGRYESGAAEGERLLRFEVTVTNGSTQSVNPVVLPAVRDGLGVDTKAYYGASGHKPMPPTLAPGGTATGRHAFLLPADAGDEIQVDVRTMFRESLSESDGIWLGRVG